MGGECRQGEEGLMLLIFFSFNFGEGSASCTGYCWFNTPVSFILDGRVFMLAASVA